VLRGEIDQAVLEVLFTLAEAATNDSTIFQKCKQVREQWLALRRELGEHIRKHRC